MKTSFEKILDSLANGVCAIDDAGVVTVFNTAAEKILNIKKTDIIGKHILDIIPNAGLINVLKTGRSEYGKRQEFSNLTVLTNRTPIFKNGRINGAVSVFQDITQLEKVSKELASTKLLVNTLESVIQGAQEWMVVVNKDGYITMISKAYAKFLGVKPEYAIGKHTTEIIENTRMHIVARTGIAEIGEQQRIKGRDVIVMRVPLKDEKGGIAGAYGRVMFKDVNELKNAVQKLNILESKVRYYEEELTTLRSAKYNFSNIIGKSMQIIQAKKVALKAAQSSSTVLLRGETGTGKELFAHAIHAASKRNIGPFIRVNCAAIPKELMEAELFGYEEGAFTGAKKGGKPGKFELAHGGTLFLDEIGDMPKEMQVKLLRALQEKEIERIGGSKPLPVDIRIITATSQNLEELIALGSFRTDLYYRINVISIRIPPLRERIEDIPLLIRHILNSIAEEHGEALKKCSQQVVKLLKSYNWQGNIRELRNMIEQAVAMTEGNVIDLESIPKYLSKLMITAGKPLITSVLSELKNSTEKSAIIEALKTSAGNKSKAARLLGIHRVKLYGKLKKHKISNM